MNRTTSLYLDVVRFSAALTVFVGHICGSRFTGGLFWQIGPYADEAVDVFFVLSGFVIAYVSDKRETAAREFAIARLARIYSVALPALAVTFLLDRIGTSLRPGLYSSAWGYGGGSLWQYISGLLFYSRIWYLRLTPGSDISYWSLSYEVCYYVIFGLAFFGGRRWRVIGPLVALAVAGPTIDALFPLWLLGFFCYHASSRVRLSRVQGAMLCAVPIVLWAAYEFLSWHFHIRLDNRSPTKFISRPQFFQDYLIGLLFAIHLLGFGAVSTTFANTLGRWAYQIKWIAGATFTLYLFHMPVAQFLTAVVPWAPSAWQTRMIMFPGTLAIMFIIAEVTERKKGWWRAAFARLIDRPRLVRVPEQI